MISCQLLVSQLPSFYWQSRWLSGGTKWGPGYSYLSSRLLPRLLYSVCNRIQILLSFLVTNNVQSNAYALPVR